MRTSGKWCLSVALAVGLAPVAAQAQGDWGSPAPTPKPTVKPSTSSGGDWGSTPAQPTPRPTVRPSTSSGGDWGSTPTQPTPRPTVKPPTSSGGDWGSTPTQPTPRPTPRPTTGGDWGSNPGSGSGSGQTGGDWGSNNGGAQQPGTGQNGDWGNGGTGTDWGQKWGTANNYYKKNDWGSSISEYESIRGSDWGNQHADELGANLSTSYMYRGIELYNNAVRNGSFWKDEYSQAIEYLLKAEYELLGRQYGAADMDGFRRWMMASQNYDGMKSLLLQGQNWVVRSSPYLRYWDSQSWNAARRLNIIHFYLGMCYYELGSYGQTEWTSWGFIRIDNAEMAKVYLSVFVEGWRDFGPLFERSRLSDLRSEQLTMYAEALYILGLLESKSNNSGEQAEAIRHLQEAHRQWKAVKAMGLDYLVIYMGEFSQGYRPQLFTWNNSRRDVYKPAAKKLLEIESAMLSVAKKSLSTRGGTQAAREVATYLMDSGTSENTKDEASMLLPAAAAASGDFQGAYGMHLDMRHRRAYDQHSLAAADLCREKLNQPQQALTHYKEAMSRTNSADIKAKAKAGVAGVLRPMIEQEAARNPQGAIQKALSAVTEYGLDGSAKDGVLMGAAAGVDTLMKNNDLPGALQAIQQLSGQGSRAVEMVLLSKKADVNVLQGDDKALAQTVQAIDQFASIDKGLAVSNWHKLLNMYEKKGVTGGTLDAVYNKLAAYGDGKGLQRHAKLAQEQLGTISKLDAAGKRLAYLQMFRQPNANFSAASAELKEAERLYLTQYSSPWYREIQPLAAEHGSNSSKQNGENDNTRDTRVEMSKIYLPLQSTINSKEYEYVNYSANGLQTLFSSSPATQAWATFKAAAAEYDKAFLTLQDGPGSMNLFKKKEYKANLAAKDAAKVKVDAALKAFVAAAYPGAGAAGSRETAPEVAPAFDGLNEGAPVAPDSGE